MSERAFYLPQGDDDSEDRDLFHRDDFYALISKHERMKHQRFDLGAPTARGGESATTS